MLNLTILGSTGIVSLRSNLEEVILSNSEGLTTSYKNDESTVSEIIVNIDRLIEVQLISAPKSKEVKTDEV